MEILLGLTRFFLLCFKYIYFIAMKSEFSKSLNFKDLLIFGNKKIKRSNALLFLNGAI